MMEKMVDYAVRYAKFGWPVFPCHSMRGGRCSCGKDCNNPGKHPRTKSGFKEATTDEQAIRDWWTIWPDANIAVMTGPDSSIWVLDVDLPDGPESIKKWDQLPDTMMQHTGGGGRQYFFRWNGHKIKNSAGKLAPGIDVRGIGGYVLLPPSNHESGGVYRWSDRKDILTAPAWLSDMVAREDKPAALTRSISNESQYGRAALTNEIIKLSAASEGQRNQTLNACAFSLSQLIAGGELDEATVKNALMSSALAIGLKQSEAEKTIESGFRAGSCKPRAGNRLTELTELTELTPLTATNAKLTQTNAGGQKTNATNVKLKETYSRFEGNLTSEIRAYIKENQGSFSTSDIDRDFGLSHPKDKNLRRQALLTLVKEKLVKKDIRAAGRYHILKSDITFIDLDATDSKPFPLSMPIGLSQMVRIPKKSIIVVAGSTNAGKTALAIEFLKNNLHADFPLMYLMSEMGPSEYKQRVETAVDDIEHWKTRVKAASINSAFDAAISQHNPNGLTVIDFLEEIEGEYFRIPSDIRSIYDGLENGVALVCIQKHSKADVGRGGEGTAEKPRLYLTVDKLVYDKQSTISAVKIYKAKDYMGDNPNGLERHVSFGKYGSCVTPVSEWIYCSAVQRESWKQHYEAKGCPINDRHSDDKGLCFFFKTDSGASVRIIERDIDKWRGSFQNINVDLELLKIVQQSEKKPFLNEKKYFWQLSGILSKKNKEASGQYIE